MSDDDKRQIARHEVRAAQLQTLRRHLPAMQTSQGELAHSTGQLQFTQGTTTLFYAWNGLNTLAGLHVTAIAALVQEHDFSAHALARDAIHIAVNVMYVLDDPGGDRLTGALRHLLDAQRTRFVAWQMAAPEDEVVRQRVEQLASSCRQSPWYADAPAWLPLGTRADAVGVGHWVHPLLADAANAEQAMARELINFLECERGSQEARQAAHMYRTVRCGSDALYTETVALHLFAQVLQKMASVLKDTVAATVAESVIERLDVILDEHHRLAKAHRDDDNIYIRVN